MRRGKLYTDEVGANYYLMKVTKAINTTTKCVRDSWVTTIVKGSEIFEGLYYDFVSTIHYKLGPKECAVVPAASLLYVC